jgi:mono/diheme cytochrome c family protein
MQKEELKTCVKCGEHYFGEHCVGCHSNQYAHYNAQSPLKNKLLIAFAFLVIVGLVLANR